MAANERFRGASSGSKSRLATLLHIGPGRSVGTDSCSWLQSPPRLRIALPNQPRRGEMRKAILPVALVVAVGVGFAVMNATAKDKPKGAQHGATIHVIEHATTDSVAVDA